MTTDTINADAEQGYVSLLETWKILLSDAANTPTPAKLRPGAVLNLIEKHPALGIGDARAYFSAFDDLVQEALMVVLAEVADLDLSQITQEEDPVKYRKNYLNIFLGWLSVVRYAEANWGDYEDDLAGAYALRDVSNLLLSAEGLVAHLDVIGVQVTEDEMEAMNEAVQFGPEGEEQ